MPTQTISETGIDEMRQGPLTGMRIVEFAGIGPGPFAAMLLADMGAEIVRIERPGEVDDPHEVLHRNRIRVSADLKDVGQRDAILALLEHADALIEGFRPGVMERLGLSPDVVRARNPRLVYGRMTGWGQDGPLAHAAGHDINYISITGALDAIGTAEKPVPPLNLVGDYGGGALYLVTGVLAGVISARETGRGQVVDAAICDGAASLMAVFTELTAKGLWRPGRCNNMLDGGAPYYGVYACADGKHVSIGPLELQFYQLLRDKTGLDAPEFDLRDDAAHWPMLRLRLEALFLTRTRDEWVELLEGSDACFAPVLTLEEAPHHAHMAARQTHISLNGLMQPAPAPRFSETPSPMPKKSRCAAIGDAVTRWAQVSSSKAR